MTLSGPPGKKSLNTALGFQDDQQNHQKKTERLHNKTSDYFPETPATQKPSTAPPGETINTLVEEETNEEDDTESTKRIRDRALKEMVEVFYEENENSKYQRNLSGVVQLGIRNFVVEAKELVLSVSEKLGFVEKDEFSPPRCLGLELNDDVVNKIEEDRENSGRGVKTSWAVAVLYKGMCRLLDIGFGGRPIPRFWFLETVARMPYFAYLSSLHFLSTLGWWRSAQLRNVHHAEELNEHFHLLIMESLGGDRSWGDRFLAFHVSIAYYWFLILLFFVSPRESYAFSELLETHAVDTYEVFLNQNKEKLKLLPCPQVAIEYYNHYLYYFDEFQTQREKGSRRPKLENLYDVFQSVLDDEKEHVKTMKACRSSLKLGELVTLPESTSITTGFKGSARTGRIQLPVEKRRKYWKKWAEDLVDDKHADADD